MKARRLPHLRSGLVSAMIVTLLSAAPELSHLHAKELQEAATNQKIPLEQALKQLASRFDIQLVYDAGQLASRQASAPTASQSLQENINALLLGTGMNYRLENNILVIFEEERNKTGNDILGKKQLLVRGTVKDGNGEALSGVSIRINNRGQIHTTDGLGRYSISATADDSLSFSMIGFIRKTLAVDARNIIDVVLQEDQQSLDEVVVTALGIKREQKALGYSMSTVAGEQLTDAMSANWTDALTGKVAGLNLVKSGAGPDGTNQIILRGEKSMTGNNAALIIVDGAIISGSSGQMTGQGYSNYLSDDSPVDFGNSISDLNPDDIESVSILKGPGASALYGYRGANGAIIITTKQGNAKQKGLGISFSSNTYIGTINRWPDYQYEYGQGVAGGDLYYSYGQTEDGPSTFSTSSAWGPKFDGQMFYQYSPDSYRLPTQERTLWRAYENNRKDFFDISNTFTNNLSISGGNDRTSARLSYTNTNNSWIVPNTGFQRHALALQLNHKIADKLSVSTKVNYNIKTSDNLPTSGYNNQTIMYFIRGLTPNMNIDYFREYWRPGEEGITQTRPYSNLLDNPFLQAYEMLNDQNRNNIIGNASATYSFNDLFSLTFNTNLDMSYDERSQRRPFSSYRFANGYYRETNVFAQEFNNDFLFRYTNNRSANFKHGVFFGGAMMKNKYIKDELTTRNLIYPGIFNFANSAEALTSSPNRKEYAVNSLYSMANIGYKDLVFLDATARVDWASTLASPSKQEVKPFFYPSINTSFIISDAFELPKLFSFWKVRASVAEVGGGGDTPYLNSYTYSIANNYTAGLLNPTLIPYEDLGYESTRSYEIGTDVRLFKSRLGLDLALYSTSTFNQILSVPIDPSSGYTSEVVNAGKVTNKGIEIAIDGKPIVNKEGFSWNVNANFTAYNSKVISLPDSVDNIVLSTVYGSRGTVEARVGGLFGDMYGFGYLRSPSGDIIYEDGLPQMSNELMYLGNANANIKVGLGNEFKYKNFRFNFLFDGQFGGVGYSLTHAVLMEEGKLKKTLPGRYNGIIGNGVVDNGDGTYSPNTTVATSARDYYYAHFNRDNLEANTFSTDFIKLRELRLDYTLPKELASRLKLNKAVIGIYGRDLFVFTNWPSFDPEFGSLNASGIEKGAEIGQFPSTRTFGLNLAVSF